MTGQGLPAYGTAILINIINENGILPTNNFQKSYFNMAEEISCLLYTSDAADDLLCVDLGGRRIIKKKKNTKKKHIHKYNTLSHIYR